MIYCYVYFNTRHSEKRTISHRPFIIFNEFIVDSVGSDNDLSDLCLATHTTKEQCDSQVQKDWLSIAIIFIAIFTIGTGSTCLFTFGIPYVDDNNAKNKSPLALSFAMASRVCGPSIGYILGSFTLRVFANPGQNHAGETA